MRLENALSVGIAAGSLINLNKILERQDIREAIFKDD